MTRVLDRADSAGPNRVGQIAPKFRVEWNNRQLGGRAADGTAERIRIPQLFDVAMLHDPFGTVC